MKTIKELLDEVINLEGKVQISQAIDFHKGVPTLEKGVYREPELWVYDCNGESRYKDLAAYLQAYIDDDVSASEVKWKLADM